jgi:hypothetical protein
MADLLEDGLGGEDGRELAVKRRERVSMDELRGGRQQPAAPGIAARRLGRINQDFCLPGA